MKTAKQIIEGGGKNPSSHVVEKSNPLLALAHSEFKLAEFKMLDAYLARIDSRVPEKRTVRFEHGQLEKYLGVIRITKSDLEKRLDSLSRTVTLEDPDEENHAKKIALFEEIDYRRDEYGTWSVEMTCTPAAQKYFFNIEHLGYLRYKLHSILDLQSKFTYLLFLYLESNRHKHTSWNVTVPEFRELLGLTSPSYKEFKYVRKYIDAAQKELSEKTGCVFTYTTKRKGYYIYIIRFKLQPLNEDDMMSIVEADQEPEDPFPAEFAKMSEYDKEHWMIKEIFGDMFNDKEITLLHDYLEDVPRWNLPQHAAAIPDDIYLQRYHYMQEVRHRYEAATTRKEIKIPFLYVSTIILKDTERGGES